MRPDFSGPITRVNDVGEIVLMSRGHLYFVPHPRPISLMD